MKILVTGGAGFIGSHAVEHFLKNTTWDIVVLDRLTYAANGLSRLKDINAFGWYGRNGRWPLIQIQS